MEPPFQPPTDFVTHANQTAGDVHPPGLQFSSPLHNPTNCLCASQDNFGVSTRRSEARSAADSGYQTPVRAPRGDYSNFAVNCVSPSACSPPCASAFSPIMNNNSSGHIPASHYFASRENIQNHLAMPAPLPSPTHNTYLDARSCTNNSVVHATTGSRDADQQTFNFAQCARANRFLFSAPQHGIPYTVPNDSIIDIEQGSVPFQVNVQGDNVCVSPNVANTSSSVSSTPNFSVPAPAARAQCVPSHCMSPSASASRVATPLRQPARVHFSLPDQPSPVRRSSCIRSSPVSTALPKLPAFKPAHPVFWFNLVEQTFSVCALDDDARFACLMNHLHDRVDLIYDLVKTPPLVEKYATAKQTIIERVSRTRGENVRQLIFEEILGNRSPSELWRCLRLLVDDNDLPDNTLAEVWTEKLPLPVQSAISAFEDRPINERLRAADRAHSARLRELRGSSKAGRLAAPSAPKMRRNPSASASVEDPGQSPPPPTHAQKQMPTTSYCYYHNRFGEAAKKCLTPCCFPNAPRR